MVLPSPSIFVRKSKNLEAELFLKNNNRHDMRDYWGTVEEREKIAVESVHTLFHGQGR